jgi:hypothetical protein
MISIVFREICNSLKPVNNFSIHVCLDGNIFFDEIQNLILEKN